MPSVQSLRQQGLALADDIKKLLDDGRPMSAKKADVDRLTGDLEAVRKQYDALAAIDRGGFGAFGDNYGQQPFGQSALTLAGYKAVGTPQLDFDQDQARELYEAVVSRKSFAVDLKVTDSSAIAPAGITQYVLPPVQMRREPERVLSLLPTVAAQGPSVTWYSTTGTTAADAVAEGGTKPTSTLSYTANTSTATKIAHVAEVTEETLQDFAGFMGALQSDMVAGLIKAENNELLNATVTGAHKFAGLLNTSGILTRATSTDSNLDAISKAFDDLRAGSSFAQPDGIVMHPSTWGSTRRSKDGQNRYYLAPDPTKDSDMTLWGVPVVLTTQIAAGTALIGAFRDAVQVYIRDGIRVETGVGEAQFKNNTVLVRCETREILTVPRPSGLIKVTGLA